MKLIPIAFASLSLIAASQAFAGGDSSEKIPAPVLEMRAAGTLPTEVAVVKDSKIPAPVVSVVPASQTTPNYDNYNVDARGTTHLTTSNGAAEESVTR